MLYLAISCLNIALKTSYGAVVQIAIFSCKGCLSDHKSQNNYQKYYLHYINYGQREKRKAADGSVANPIKVYNGVDYSAVYDYNYYVKNNPDVKKEKKLKKKFIQNLWIHLKLIIF